jgi:hypothetical protein
MSPFLAFSIRTFVKSGAAACNSCSHSSMARVRLPRGARPLFKLCVLLGASHCKVLPTGCYRSSVPRLYEESEYSLAMFRTLVKCGAAACHNCSHSNIAWFRLPRGRPAGLPLAPFLNCVFL